MKSKKAAAEPGTIVIEYPSGRVEKTACNRHDKTYSAKVDGINKLVESGKDVKWRFDKKPQHEIDAEIAAKKKARDEAKNAGKPRD